MLALLRLCGALLAFCACGFSPVATSDGGRDAGQLDGSNDASPWLTGWAHRKSITLLASKIEAPNDGALAAFPVVVALADPDIAAGAAGDGHDLAFTSADGTTRLSHDLETYAASGLVAWVAIPSLSATTDTQIYLYYGNPNAVAQPGAATWSTDFMAVYHLQDDPGTGATGDMRDATSNHRDGTANSSMTSANRVPGDLGPAIEFEGTNDSIQVASMNFGDTFTISMWIDLDNVGQIRTFLANSSDGSNTNGFRFFVNSDMSNDRQVRFETGNGGSTATAMTATGAITSQIWTNVAAIVNRPAATATVVIDGVVANADDKTILSSFNTSGSFLIGRMNTDNPFSGLIDEVEISSTSRSIEWLHTAYTNQYRPDEFYVVGPEESF